MHQCEAARIVYWDKSWLESRKFRNSFFFHFEWFVHFCPQQNGKQKRKSLILFCERIYALVFMQQSHWIENLWIDERHNSQDIYRRFEYYVYTDICLVRTEFKRTKREERNIFLVLSFNFWKSVEIENKIFFKKKKIIEQQRRHRVDIEERREENLNLFFFFHSPIQSFHFTGHFSIALMHLRKCTEKHENSSNAIFMHFADCTQDRRWQQPKARKKTTATRLTWGMQIKRVFRVQATSSILKRSII